MIFTSSAQPKKEPKDMRLASGRHQAAIRRAIIKSPTHQLTVTGLSESLGFHIGVTSAAIRSLSARCGVPNALPRLVLHLWACHKPECLTPVIRVALEKRIPPAREKMLTVLASGPFDSAKDFIRECRSTPPAAFQALHLLRKELGAVGLKGCGSFPYNQQTLLQAAGLSLPAELRQAHEPSVRAD